MFFDWGAIGVYFHQSPPHSHRGDENIGSIKRANVLKFLVDFNSDCRVLLRTWELHCVMPVRAKM